MGPSAIKTHRAHDYRFLVRRWRDVAKASGLTRREFATAAGHDVFYLQSRAPFPAIGGIYISAGIHGDEPAGTEALIRWAEKNARRLNKLALIIFPCLNPWGLVNNCRYDEQGRDLNRAFKNEKVPMIQTLKKLIAPYRFALSLTLHEDYDGQGLYIYEIKRRKPFWGEELIEIARPIIPIEGRTSIDGRRSNSGLVRRRINLKNFPVGIPEAVYLHLHHSDRTFTFETPSEFALDQRVRAHVALIEACVGRVLKPGKQELRKAKRSDRLSSDDLSS